MASCTGGATSPVPLDPARIDALAKELHRCVKKDHLVKAKFILKGLKRDDKHKIVSQVFDGNPPLFIASQQGQVHFVNYLLEECGADIEQRGVYEVQEDHSRHRVTPLWCAAVANKLEVVKTLIKHGADVNATSDTQSTPVRSACYMTNIDVVKYLVENGADIHKPNINGGTCLINSVQSVDLCRFLIDRGADVNAQDNSGNLALHYAIREGRMETVKLLMKHGSDPYVRNDFGDDAIQTAALRGYAEILDYLFIRVKPAIERQIEANELLGTNFVDEKHDIQRAIQIWRTAMTLRFQDPENPIIRQERLRSSTAYQDAKEPETFHEFEQIVRSPDAVYMQALLIRERILGPDHKDTIFGLMYRGAVYADTHHYQRCVDLWKYAFQLRHEKQEPLNHECLFTLQALCKLFWEIEEEHAFGFTNEAIKYNDVIEVLGMAINEIESAKSFIEKDEPKSQGPVCDGINQKEEFHVLMLLFLHLIHLVCKINKDCQNNIQFKQMIHRGVKLKARGSMRRSLLHLAVEKKASTVVEEFYSRFPSPKVVDLLLECGAPVNDLDEQRNTPLHLCADALVNNSLEGDDLRDMKLIVISLLENNAHMDTRNAQGQTVISELANTCGSEQTNTGNNWLANLKIDVMEHTSLKCLAAREVKKHALCYKGEVPFSLIPFIEMH